jgi:hypothetical protein
MKTGQQFQYSVPKQTGTFRMATKYIYYSADHLAVISANNVLRRLFIECTSGSADLTNLGSQLKFHWL